MEHKKSLLNSSSLPITPQIELYIPTVGEILEDEKYYYNLVFSLCATPSDYMVQLDDAGIDYTKITDYELFLMLFQMHKTQDFSLLFPKLDMSGFQICSNSETQEKVLYDEMSGIMLDSLITSQITDTLRLINGLKKHVVKPGNDEAKRYLLEKERKRIKRNANKPYKSQIENLVIALVNRAEFKYNYEEVMDLSIYKFNQSFNQIRTGINFHNTMRGIYAGTIDISKITDKASLSWISED